MSNQNLVGKDRSESESSNNDRFSPGFRMRAVSEIYSLDNSGFAIFSPDSRGAPEIASEHQVFTPTCGEEVTSPVDTTLLHTKSEVIRSSPTSSEVTRSVRSSTRTRNRLFSELSISDMPTDFGEGKLSRCFPLNVDPTPSLDINLPCSYEEEMEVRGLAVAQLTQAAVKRVLLRHGYDFLIS